MDKPRIIEEMRRLALENGGKAPGRQAFERRSGIRSSDWYPHLWLRWGEALLEAGVAPNRLATATSDETLIQSYVSLTRELQHLPVGGEIRRKGRADSSFPSHTVFARLGRKEKLLAAVLKYCLSHQGHDDIVALLQARKQPEAHGGSARNLREPWFATGFVYLMKSGRHYKIGRTNSVGTRERQLAIKIPIRPTTVHTIETDDPAGVEDYWHSRFAEKRGEGEWFDLSADDISAFKRWKRIV